MPGDVLARAWALKAACYQAWHTAPRQADDAAAALQALVDAQPQPCDLPVLRALAAWTAGIAHLAQGRLPQALVQLQAAQAQFDAIADGQHAAETQVPQMVALAMLGRDADALRCAEGALAQFLASGDERSAGKIELNLGTMLSRQDRHAAAEAHFRRAAVRFARTGDTEHSISADIALANALLWRQDFDEALRVNERARMRAQTHGYAVLRAHAHQAIGHIALHRGERHRALREMAEACRLLTDAGAPPQRCVEAEAALADAYLSVNLLVEAEALYTRVIAAALDLQAPAEEARARLHRAQTQARMGLHQAASLGFAQARALYQAQGNAATVAFCDLCQGHVALAAGQAEDARASAERAAPVFQAQAMPGWWLQARTLQAAALAALGQADAARAGYQAVLAAATGLSQLALPCHTGLGALALQAGDLPAARRALDAALALVDEARQALPDDSFRSAVAADADAAHALLVDLALCQGDAAQLLADLERGRARALALSLAGADAGQAPTPASTGLQWLREQWRQAMADGDSQRLPGLGTQLQAQEQALLEAQRRAVLQVPLQTAGRVDHASPVPAALVAAVQQALPAGTAMLSYHLQATRLVACVVTAQGVAHRVLVVPELAERLRALRFQIDTPRMRSPALQAHAPLLLQRVRVHLQALHALLWAPVAALLQGCHRVVLVPHRELHYLPFAALHDGQHSLVQNHELVLAPSAQVWLHQQARPVPPPRRLLALGVGDAALPQVGPEIEAVAAAFGGEARCLHGVAASQAALFSLGPDADVLHLACHGRFRADNPAFSMLQLGDGPLALHALQALRLQAGLVVLSACETGVSQQRPGDEMLGLVRAFMLAGASNVLATLWPVDDQATAALMTNFYRRLQGGAGPAAALQQAQASCAAAGQHPFHWAAFALSGRG